RAMVRRLLAPPAFPAVVSPRPAGMGEHVAAQDPGADAFHAAPGEVLIYAALAVALAVHLLEGVGREEPFVQVLAADAEGILQALVRAGAEAVDRDGIG